MALILDRDRGPPTCSSQASARRSRLGLTCGIARPVRRRQRSRNSAEVKAGRVPSKLSISRRVFTRIGMIIKDASVTVLTIPGWYREERDAALVELERASGDVAVLLGAIRLVARSN